MRSFSRPIAIAAALFLSVSAAAAQHLLSDVSGKWRAGIAMGDRTTESTITFKQSGDTLTGTIESEQAGTRPIDGMVKGDTVRFDFSFDMQGTMLAIQVDGVLKDKDNMTGQFVLPNGMGSFPFTAKREP